MASVVVEAPAVESPEPRSRRPKIFRVLGLLLVAAAVAFLVFPVSYGAISGGGRIDCGVPLQGLFRPPNEGCQLAADHRVPVSLGFALTGALFLAFSRLKRPLRFVGVVVLALSPYLMMFGIEDINREIVRGGKHFVYFCGSAIGDLTRRSYTEISERGATSGIHRGCGEGALTRLYITLGVAAVGVALLGIDAIRQRKASARLG